MQRNVVLVRLGMAKNCTIDGCASARIARGLCRAHYKRLMKYGDPLKGGTGRNAAARFFTEIVLAYDGDECLIWPYARNAAGYGVIKKPERVFLVSRLACEAARGPAPTTLHEAAHSCGNGASGCVAKAHLYWATSAENKGDMIEHGHSQRGTRHWSTQLTEDDVREIRRLRGALAQGKIARMFGVSVPTVSEIQNRKSWSWLP